MRNLKFNRLFAILVVLIITVSIFAVSVSADSYHTTSDYGFDVGFTDTNGYKVEPLEFRQGGEVYLEAFVNDSGPVTIDESYGFWVGTLAYKPNGSIIANPGSYLSFELSSLHILFSDENVGYYDSFEDISYSVVVYYNDGSSEVISGLHSFYNEFAKCLVFDDRFYVNKPIVALDFAIYGSPYEHLGYAPGLTDGVKVTYWGKPVLSLLTTEIVPGDDDFDDTFWDDMLNGSKDPVKPDDFDNIQDMDDLESSLTGSTDDAVDLITENYGLSIQGITAFSSGFLFVTSALSPLLDIPVVKWILSISLTLGSFAFLCGFLSFAVRSFSRESSRKE